MGGSSTHQGYDRELFLLAESHGHSTIICVMAAVGGFGKIQPCNTSKELIKSFQYFNKVRNILKLINNS